VIAGQADMDFHLDRNDHTPQGRHFGGKTDKTSRSVEKVGSWELGIHLVSPQT
jgi:hypothetical protein